MQTIWVVAGTRPEIVKLAPVYRALRERLPGPVAWVATGQHTDLGDQALSDFEIVPDVRLALPRGDTQTRQAELATKGASGKDTVARVLADLIANIDQALSGSAPSLVVVQGDTTSTVAAGLAAFSRRIPVVHVEAGLRTFDLAHPFPEEAWRSIVSQISRVHFAPTERAARNLVASGVKSASIHVTGNTVIDALHWLLMRDGAPSPKAGSANRRLLTVTLHRRENWNEAFDEVCEALVALRNAFADIEICFVAHANPALADKAREALGNEPRVRVVAPLGYVDFVRLMRASTLILSDSGGVQEEAPALGVPVCILRDTTERPEAVEEGVAELVGTQSLRIVAAATRLLTDEDAYRRMSRATSPFGDGKAAERIAQIISDFLARSEHRRVA